MVRDLVRLRATPILLKYSFRSDPDTRGAGFRLSSRGAGERLRYDISVFQLTPLLLGYLFGEDIFNKFIHLNGFDYMVRAHQLCMEGYQELFQNRFCTVWSAPNCTLRSGSAREYGRSLNGMSGQIVFALATRHRFSPSTRTTTGTSPCMMRAHQSGESRFRAALMATLVPKEVPTSSPTTSSDISNVLLPSY